MPVYHYKAIDSLGKVQAGSSDADSLEILTQTLKGHGLFLMEGRIASSPSPSAGPATATASKRLDPASGPSLDPAQMAKWFGSLSLKEWRGKKAVPTETLVNFTMEFAIMVKTSLPIVGTMECLQKQQSHPKFKSALGEICRLVIQGSPLSTAFSRFPAIFNPIYISLLAAGEASGTLPLMLERLATYLTFQQELRSKIRLALLYPLMIVSTCLIVMSFLVFFILPSFANVFSEMSLELPLPTRVLLALSHHLRAWWWLYILGGSALGAYGARWVSNPARALTVDTFRLKLPVIGHLVRNIVMTRVLRTLASLVGSGVPILMSLDLSRAAAANAVFRATIDRMHASASGGKGLAAPLYRDPYFPEAVAHMIANAEKIGALPEVLSKAADYYEHETDNTIKRTFAVVEPLFVIFLGMVVAGIAVAVLLPIFKLNADLQ